MAAADRRRGPGAEGSLRTAEAWAERGTICRLARVASRSGEWAVSEGGLSTGGARDGPWPLSPSPPVCAGRGLPPCPVRSGVLKTGNARRALETRATLGLLPDARGTIN
ncbi:hypothetical protein NDU88_001265 [Pleurodeles waltl]|uniref:Uncharacterized protein n=1 Tax=Pleurodeles waltl TaxID=8319 RepID=A0AAV7VYX1_PLEWA|nr:hypothetical protein NDU88_001265 [Pleurodeles waltl]